MITKPECHALTDEWTGRSLKTLASYAELPDENIWYHDSSHQFIVLFYSNSKMEMWKYRFKKDSVSYIGFPFLVGLLLEDLSFLFPFSFSNNLFPWSCSTKRIRLYHRERKHINSKYSQHWGARCKTFMITVSRLCSSETITFACIIECMHGLTAK